MYDERASDRPSSLNKAQTKPKLGRKLRQKVVQTFKDFVLNLDSD
jgi:hypothetical protein